MLYTIDITRKDVASMFTNNVTAEFGNRHHPYFKATS